MQFPSDLPLHAYTISLLLGLGCNSSCAGAKTHSMTDADTPTQKVTYKKLLEILSVKT